MNTKNKFYLLLVGIIFLLIACNEQQEESIKDINHTDEKNPLIIENILNSAVQVPIIVDKPTERNSNLKNIQDLQAKPSVDQMYRFKNLDKKSSVLHFKDDIYNFSNISQPIVMVNLSSTWCPPCRGEVPHLNSLQKKFKNHLFILTALVHDDIDNVKLKKLIVSEKVRFFVSIDLKENEKFERMITKKLGINNHLKLPLMILFYNGKYFTHYEGSMPEEMIESDIKQLLEKIKRETDNV